MRLVSISSILLLFCCSLCNGQAPGSTATTSTTTAVATEDSQLSDSSRLEQKIYAAFKEPGDFQFNEVPWSKIEELFEQKYRINIVLTSSAMDDSLTADEPISVDLQGVSLKIALRQMLEPKNATWVVQDGVVKLISLDDAEDEKYFTTQFINVRNLLANISKLESNRIGKPRLIQRRPHGGVKVAGGQAHPQELVAGVVTAESMLIDLIQTSIHKDYWEESGQGLATIKIIGGYMLVTGPDLLTDSVKDFLSDLDYHLPRD